MVLAFRQPGQMQSAVRETARKLHEEHAGIIQLLDELVVAVEANKSDDLNAALKQVSQVCLVLYGSC